MYDSPIKQTADRILDAYAAMRQSQDHSNVPDLDNPLHPGRMYHNEREKLNGKHPYLDVRILVGANLRGFNGKQVRKECWNWDKTIKFVKAASERLTEFFGALE